MIGNYEYPLGTNKVWSASGLRKYDVSEVAGLDIGFGSCACDGYARNYEEASTRLFASAGNDVARGKYVRLRGK